MRKIVLAASAMMLASCATPDMNAMNANMGGQQASDAARNAEEPPVPIQFRRPARTIDGWGAPGSGGMY